MLRKSQKRRSWLWYLRMDLSEGKRFKQRFKSLNLLKTSCLNKTVGRIKERIEISKNHQSYAQENKFYRLADLYLWKHPKPNIENGLELLKWECHGKGSESALLPISNKRNQSPLEKWLILWVGQEKY